MDEVIKQMEQQKHDLQTFRDEQEEKEGLLLAKLKDREDDIAKMIDELKKREQ